MKTFHFVPEDLTKFMDKSLKNEFLFGIWACPRLFNKSYNAVSHQGIPSLFGQIKETRSEKEIIETNKVCIGNSLNYSRATLTGEKTPEHFRITAANSNGRLTCYADEKQRILSIVPMDYQYSVLQDLFNCLSKTIAAAKVHCILFGRGGTPPAKF